MISIQRVGNNLNEKVLDPYNEIKNDMKVLDSHSNDLKLKTKSAFTSVYLYVIFLIIASLGIVTKSSMLLLFSGIVLGGIVLINILHLAL
mgnify:CR=1 FL=1